MLAYSPATFTAPHFAGLGSQFDPSPYSRQSRLQELRRVEAAIQAEIAEEEARRRHLAQRAALEFALRQQAEERRRRQEAEAEARMIAAAIARRQERAREIALARYAQEKEYRRRVEYARQQQQNAQLRQQLEAHRQRARQAQIAPALVQLVVDIFASQQQQEEDHPEERDEPKPAAPVKTEKHVEFADDTNSPAVENSEPAKAVAATTSPAANEPDLEDAAKVLQRRFRRHAARRSALEQLSSLAKDLVTRRREFEAPVELHFQSSPAFSDSTLTPSSAPLAYDKSNKSFLGYEDFLVSLLSKIDAVESNGDKVVQRARKGLVAQVEKELSRLDELKQHEWERQSGVSSSSSSGAASDSEEVAAEEEELAAPATGTSDVVAKASDENASPSPVPADAPTLGADATAVSDAADSKLATHTSPEQAEAVATGSKAAEPVHAEPVAEEAYVAETETSPSSDVVAPTHESTSSPPTADAPEPAIDTTAETSLAHDDSDSSASSSDDEVDAVVAEVLKRAQALGEQVEALEQAEETEQIDAPSTSDIDTPTRSDDEQPKDKNETESAQEEVIRVEAAAPAAAESAPASEDANEPVEASALSSSVDGPVQEAKVDDGDKEDSKSEAATEDFEML